jgi:hypothetical protein
MRVERSEKAKTQTMMNSGYTVPFALVELSADGIINEKCRNYVRYVSPEGRMTNE